MQAYKIVQNVNGRYYSWYYRAEKIEYSTIFETIAPENGVKNGMYLFIFIDLYLAKQMPHLKQVSNLEIWEVDAKETYYMQDPYWPKNCGLMTNSVKLIRRVA